MESGGGEGGVLGQMARETRANGLTSLWGGYGATLRDLRTSQSTGARTTRCGLLRPTPFALAAVALSFISGTPERSAL